MQLFSRGHWPEEQTDEVKSERSLEEIGAQLKEVRVGVRAQLKDLAAPGKAEIQKSWHPEAQKQAIELSMWVKELEEQLQDKLQP